MTDFKATLLQLHQNLNLLHEREAKYGGNPPLELLNQISDYRQAIALTEQVIAEEITEAAWQAALQPLLVSLRQGDAPVQFGDKFDMSGDYRGSNVYVKLDNRFLTIVMNSVPFRNEIKTTATGTTVRHTSPEKLLTPFIPIIDPDEQLRIVKVIGSIDLMIEATKLDARKQRTLKTGLMQDLLTGRVRVTGLMGEGAKFL